jgi:hypothetical protein
MRREKGGREGGRVVTPQLSICRSSNTTGINITVDPNTQLEGKHKYINSGGFKPSVSMKQV